MFATAVRVSRFGVFAALIGTCAALSGAPARAADTDLLKRLGCGEVEASAAPFTTEALEDGRLDILVVGSSSTAGVGAGGKDRSYPLVAARLLRNKAAESGAPVQIEVAPRGVGGETAAGALARLAEELDRIEPDLLVWQVGTNDAVRKAPLDQLERTIRRGVRLARERGAAVALVDPQFYPRIESDARYAAVVEMIDRLGVEIDAPVVRRFERMRAAAAQGETALAMLLAKDRFHMSPLGHECLARDLAETILPMAYLARFQP